MEPLCHIDAIAEGGSKGFILGPLSLLAIKHQGVLYLYRNRCPHRGIPLEWQPDQFLDIDRNYIQCSTHGALFEIDSGRCIQGPCQGQALEAIDYTLANDRVWVTSPPNTP